VRRRFLFVGFWLFVSLLVGCAFGTGISDLSVLSASDGDLEINFKCSKTVDTVNIKVFDADGVRYDRLYKIGEIQEEGNGNCRIVLGKEDLGDGFYPTGTLTVTAFRDSKAFGSLSASVSLPMTIPDSVRIEKAYRNGNQYVLVVRAEKDGKSAVFGHTLRIYVGDMSGRQLYLRDVDVFHKRGSVKISIPLSDMRIPYTAHILLKVKLLDFGISDQVVRKAWDRAPLSAVGIKVTKDRRVKVCPKVVDKCVPIVGSVEVNVKDSGYLLWSIRRAVKYEDFSRGWVDIGSVSDVKFSTTGYADIIAKVKDSKYEVTGTARLTGLIKYSPPTDMTVSYKNGKSSIDLKVCFYRNNKPTKFYGRIDLSIYDGKTAVYNNYYTVRGDTCLEKELKYSWIGPTTWGRATLNVTAKPVVGKPLKASKRLSGLWAKVYAVGEYIAGLSWTDAALMKFYVTDAKFIKRGERYYFGIFVTIYNKRGGTPYVSAYDFNAIDSLGNIYDATYLGETGEFNSGRIYAGHSRKGWIFFKIPVGTNIYEIKYVKIGFENVWGEWYTLVTIKVYPYMYKEISSYSGI